MHSHAERVLVAAGHVVARQVVLLVHVEAVAAAVVFQVSEGTRLARYISFHGHPRHLDQLVVAEIGTHEVRSGNVLRVRAVRVKVPMHRVVPRHTAILARVSFDRQLVLGYDSRFRIQRVVRTRARGEALIVRWGIRRLALVLRLVEAAILPGVGALVIVSIYAGVAAHAPPIRPRDRVALRRALNHAVGAKLRPDNHLCLALQ